LHRDLANAYYLAGYYEEAQKTLDPIIKSGQADEQSFQVMAASYLEQKEDRKAKNYLQKGLERYPHSGLLYNQQGKMQEALQNEEEALKSWLNGIEQDPAFHLNYYDAARTYMRSTKTVWAVIYGEIFLNMEQQTARANETRTMLVAAYKRLYNSFAVGEMPKYKGKDKSPGLTGFEGAVYNTYLKLSPVVSDGFNIENLVMLRTRFMIEWTEQHAKQYPFTLFKRQDDMLRNGYFDTYNQWLFGKAISPQEYDAWNKFHEKEMPAFEEWLKSHPYQALGADIYNKKDVSRIFPKKKD
jgi:tetratricopeptide (TPR) repeat protein